MPCDYGTFLDIYGTTSLFWYASNERNTNKISHLQRFCKWLLCGGGGNRTRVPRHLHASFYVCSRMISAFAILAPNRRGGKTASRERFLISGVPHVDPKRSGIVAGSRTSPAKVLSRGNLSLGGHCEAMLGN